MKERVSGEIAAIFSVLIIMSSTSVSQVRPFGVNGGGTGRHLSAVADAPGAGIVTLRIGLGWLETEPTNGYFDFSNLDANLSQARANGLTVILTFSRPPAWTNPADWPQFLSDYGDFVDAVVSHCETNFPAVVDAYGPWNEPNYGSWTADEYLDILATARSVVGPNVKLFGPDTLHMYSVDPDGAYFDYVIQQGCASLDYLSGHFYYFGDPCDAADQMFDKIDNTIEPLALQDCPGLPYWVTEFGIHSAAVGETEQAQEYVKAYEGTLERPFIDRMYLFSLADLGNYACGQGPRPGGNDYCLASSSPYDCDSGIPYTNCNCTSNPDAWVNVPFSFGLLGWYYPHYYRGSYTEKESYFAVRDFSKAVREERVIDADAAASGGLVLSEGGGSVTLATTTAQTGVDDVHDCLWSVVNDYEGASGLNVMVAHPGEISEPSCGQDCDYPGQNYEQVDHLKIRISGLQPGAHYKVYVRYATEPGSADPRGVSAYIPDNIGWKVFDQSTPGYEIIGDWTPSQPWQVREALLDNGDSNTAEVGQDGILEVHVDDGTYPGNPCTLTEAVFSGLRLVSSVDPITTIFAEGFEGGDPCAWGLPNGQLCLDP